MKVSLLKEKAKSLGIKKYYKMKKQELLDSIKEIEEKPEAEAKDNYKCKYRKRDGIVEFSLNEVKTDKDALREFVKWFSTQQDFLLGELFKNDKKIRQIRRP